MKSANSLKPLLRVVGVTKRFGGLTAVDGVTFDVTPQEIVALIGPNGAGKTTLFSLISGFQAADEGSVAFEMADALKKADETLALVGLSERKFSVTPELSLQDRKLLEVAKCLATEPTLILLDEVMAGLTLSEAEVVLGVIRRLRSEGMTFVLVEHVMPIVMSIADRIVVMNFGQKVADGPPKEIIENQFVRDAYFGEDLHA